MLRFTNLLLFLSVVAVAQNKWPGAPVDQENPGSTSYEYSLFKETYKFSGRTIDFFAPSEAKVKGKKVPLIVFGHGQAINLDGYKMTFEHLAKKGTAVAFVEYDSGFFDQEWRRMAQDFKNLSSEVIKKYQDIINPDWVLYSGHSKGGYVALMAAGLGTDQPASLILFAPADYDRELLKNINVNVPVTLIWAETDSIVKPAIGQEIYDKLPVQKKQLITVKSYPDLNPRLPADHFFVLNKRYFFGGRDGVSPFHYYGTWKWLLGGTQDLENRTGETNTYLYGDQTTFTGIEGFVHSVQRNW